MNTSTQSSEDNSQDSSQSKEESQQSSVISNQDNSDQSSVSSNQTEENKSTEKDDEKIVEKFVSWGFEKSSGRKIDTIIIHSSYDAIGSEPFSVSGLLNEYKQYGVAAHYLIDRNGTIYQLVADKNIAYHAGTSKTPDGRTGVNAFSLGVEMMNTEDGKFTSEQYSALNYLISTLKKNYSIKYVLGHSDIAPGRKTDPWGLDFSKIKQ